VDIQGTVARGVGVGGAAASTAAGGGGGGGGGGGAASAAAASLAAYKGLERRRGLLNWETEDARMQALRATHLEGHPFRSAPVAIPSDKKHVDDTLARMFASVNHRTRRGGTS
jgi:hypothetical protein